MVQGAGAVAEAADAATGGRGDDGWFAWWRRGDEILGDMDDWGRRFRDGRGDGEWGDRIGRGFRDFDDHLRGWNRGWDGWDNRYSPVFDDWGRRWGGMRGRWDGRDWGRGDWRGHDGPFRGIWGDFDGFRRHWGRVRDEWGRRLGWGRSGSWGRSGRRGRSGWGRSDRGRSGSRVYRYGMFRSPGTELGGWH